MLLRSLQSVLLAGLIAALFTGCASTGPQSSSEEKSAVTAGSPVEPAAQQAFDAAIKAMADGKDAQAEKILLKMRKDFPGLSGPQANLGIIYFRAGKKADAEAAFLRAVEINAKNAVSLDYLGVMSRDKGEFKQAADYYQRAIKADADYAFAYRNYGILLELYMGKLAEALVQYKKYQDVTGGEDKLVAKWIIDLERRSKVKK